MTGKALCVSPMKTNADKDLKQQFTFSGQGVVKTWRKYKTKQKSTRLHKIYFPWMFYIPHWRKQYNRINFGELSLSK